MISYGLIKILQLQFVLPEEVLNQTLGQLDGVTLTWAFLGYSSWLTVILGMAELIPGVLLLFNRTKLIGILLLFPVLTAVFLINQAYGFLFYMRVFTGGLLLLDIWLLFIYRQPFIWAISSLKQENAQYQKRELTINATFILLVVALILYFLT